MRAQEFVVEKWSSKYKKSINCANPKGFSQKAHCAGRKKNEDVAEAAGLYGPFTVTINTGERPQSRTKTKKFKREDDAILWAQDWLEDAPQYVFATAKVTDPNGNVVWTTDEGVAEGLNEDATRAEAQAAYMQGECMILAVAINQLNPKRYPIGYIWEYNMSAGAPDVQLDDDEWDNLSPQEQQEISKDISRHSVVHAYVRDRDTGEYIDARGRHKTLPNLWGRLGQTRFDEFPGTARELIDITAHGDWDEAGDQVSFKRGQPAFDSLVGPAGIKRAQEYAVKYLGVEESKNKLRIGNIVRAVVDGKRVQGEVIGISSDYKEVELWLSGVNDFNPITANVRDIEPVSEQGVAENFADGKNPGRKGLSKRVGVNTKASVSSLRKTAKNSSGEKQRMAHWLANMKAGRAKAKRK